MKKSAKTDVRVWCYIMLKILGYARRPNANNLCFVTMVTNNFFWKRLQSEKINLRKVCHADTSRKGKIALNTIMLFSEWLNTSLAQKWQKTRVVRVFQLFFGFFSGLTLFLRQNLDTILCGTSKRTNNQIFGTCTINLRSVASKNL